MPMRIQRHRDARSAEENRLNKIAEKLEAMACDIQFLDALAAAQLRERAAHWRSKAWLSRSGGESGGTLCLPPELLLHITKCYCTPDGLLTHSAVNHVWRDTLMNCWEQLWREAATARFPRVATLAEIEGTTKSWREIYQCQLARDTRWKYGTVVPSALAPPPKASDFVVSFTLTAPDSLEAAIDETHRLPDSEPGIAMMSAKLWESPPAWLTAWLEYDRMSFDDWDALVDLPTLSLWISRGMKTARLGHDPLKMTRSNVDMSTVLCFERAFIDSSFGGPANDRLESGCLYVEVEMDGRLRFLFSAVQDYTPRIDNDRILRGFDKVLSNTRPTLRDLAWD